MSLLRQADYPTTDKRSSVLRRHLRVIDVFRQDSWATVFTRSEARLPDRPEWPIEQANMTRAMRRLQGPDRRRRAFLCRREQRPQIRVSTLASGLANPPA